MDQLKLAILAGFRGGLDKHGFATNDADAIHAHALAEGITDGDQARREFCASLEDDHNCPHA